MKSHFLKLLAYDKFANLEILKVIFEAAEPAQPVKLMAHLLAAQQVWFNRCNGLAPFSGALWPDWQASTFEKLINDNNDAWVRFVSSLQPGDFSKTVAYTNLKGDSYYENELSDILAHLINHGTHHRAQAGQQLKLAGIEKLPLTDYIFFIR